MAIEDMIGPYLGLAPDLGYGLIAEADSAGGMWQMMMPGASGYAVVAVPVMCRLSRYSVLTHPAGFPDGSIERLAFPALVEWQSTVDFDGVSYVPNTMWREVGQAYRGLFDKADDGDFESRFALQYLGDWGLPPIQCRVLDHAGEREGLQHVFEIDPLGNQSIETSDLDGEVLYLPSGLAYPVPEEQVEGWRTAIAELRKTWPLGDEDCIYGDFETIDPEYTLELIEDLTHHGHQESCFELEEMDGYQWITQVNCSWDPEARSSTCGGTPFFEWVGLALRDYVDATEVNVTIEQLDRISPDLTEVWALHHTRLNELHQVLLHIHPNGFATSGRGMPWEHSFSRRWLES